MAARIDADRAGRRVGRARRRRSRRSGWRACGRGWRRRCWSGSAPRSTSSPAASARRRRGCRRAGLEWLFRLSQEPLRLLPRYLRYNPAFVAAFARQYLRERRQRRRKRQHVVAPGGGGAPRASRARPARGRGRGIRRARVPAGRAPRAGPPRAPAASARRRRGAGSSRARERQAPRTGPRDGVVTSERAAGQRLELRDAVVLDPRRGDVDLGPARSARGGRPARACRPIRCPAGSVDAAAAQIRAARPPPRCPSRPAAGPRARPAATPRATISSPFLSGLPAYVTATGSRVARSGCRHARSRRAAPPRARRRELARHAQRRVEPPRQQHRGARQRAALEAVLERVGATGAVHRRERVEAHGRAAQAAARLQHRGLRGRVEDRARVGAAQRAGERAAHRRRLGEVGELHRAPEVARDAHLAAHDARPRRRAREARRRAPRRPGASPRWCRARPAGRPGAHGSRGRDRGSDLVRLGFDATAAAAAADARSLRDRPDP